MVNPSKLSMGRLRPVFDVNQNAIGRLRPISNENLKSTRRLRLTSNFNLNSTKRLRLIQGYNLNSIRCLHLTRPLGQNMLKFHGFITKNFGGCIQYKLKHQNSKVRYTNKRDFSRKKSIFSKIMAFIYAIFTGLTTYVCLMTNIIQNFAGLFKSKRIKQFKPNLSNYCFQSDNLSDNLIGSLSNLVNSHLQFSQISKLQMVSIGTILTSLIMNACLMIKHRTKIVIANFALSLVQFICMIMSFEDFKIEEETPNLLEAVQEEFMDLSQRKPEQTKITIDDPQLKEYLTRLMEFPNQKGIFVQIQRQEFPSIILPPHKLPQFYTESARQIKPFLVFPDWFLATYWDVTFETIQMWRRKCRMVSDQRANENLTDDNVSFKDSSSDEEGSTKSLKQQPKKFTKLKPKKPNLMNAKVEFDWENTSVRNILMRVVNALLYLAECKFGSKSFTVSGLRASMKNVEEDIKISGELNDIRALLMGEQTEKQKFLDTVKKYGDDMTVFLEKPTFEFAKFPKNMSNCKKLLSEFLEFYTTLSLENKSICAAVQGIYVALNQKYIQLISSEIQSMSRQEPFVVLFRGAGGIGKTQFVKKLMLECCKYLGFKPTESIVEITPDDKYWPPLANQEIAFFDEAGSKQDFSNDLLFSNLKSLCSPTFFNAAAADIPHKINPFTSKIIFATTNTSFDHLATRVTQLFDSNTWGAMCRRMIIFDCTHDDKNFGKLDPNNPLATNFDSVNFRHIINTSYIYDGFKLVKQPGVTTFTKNMILDKIYERYDRMTREHHKAMNSMLLDNQVIQDSNNHLSIVIHGRNGQGKSKLCSEIRFKLGNALHMPVYCFEKFSELREFKPTRRSIVILDDIIRTSTTLDEENFLMDFFNYVLVNNSIIIWTTNVSPKFNFMPTVSLNSIHRNLILPFVNEGLYRRIGYQGFVNDSMLSDMNMEFTIRNFNLYKIERKAVSISEFFFGNGSSFLVCLINIICSIPMLWFKTYGQQTFIQLADFPQEIYSAYMSYLAMRKEIQVEYRTNLDISGNFHLKLYGKSSRTVLKGSQKQIIDSIFTTESLYNDARLEWKIFCEKQLSLVLQRNPEKFIVKQGVYNEEFIIGIIGRYVNALIEMGNVPRLMAHIEDIGIFLYEDGVLYVDRLEVSNNMYLQVVQVNDIKYLCVNDKDILLKDVLTQPQLIYERYNCTMEESAMVSQYIKSPGFLSNPLVLNELKTIYIEDIKIKSSNLILEFNQYFNKFKSSLIGKIVLVFLTLLSAYALYKVVSSLFSTGTEITSPYGWCKCCNEDGVELAEDEEDVCKNCEKVSKKKGSPKNKNYDSDDDHKNNKKNQILQLLHEKRNKKKGSPKTKNYESDDDKKQQEDVLTLTDMNTHNSYKPYMDVAQKQMRKNLCMIYASASDEEELKKEPVSGRACYGLYLFENVLVTVGHIRQLKNVNFYAGMDSFDGKFKKMHLVQGYKFRDLSVWYTKNTPQQKDVTNLFFEAKMFDFDLTFNCCFQRFSANKVEEYHTSEFSYFEGPDDFNGGKLSKWGSAFYGLFDIKVSNGGDCGLPYYCLEKWNGFRNKVFGIHCMGNVEDTMTCGIMACIFQEDCNEWKVNMKKVKQESGDCYWCGFNETTIRPDDYPKAEGHENVWFMDHNSTMSSGIQEITYYRQRYPGFVGLIIKNSGNMKGTIEHSHTQFIPELEKGQFQDVLPDLHVWKEVDLNKVIDNYTGNSQGVSICVDIPARNLISNLQKIKTLGENFRLKVQIFKNSRDGDLMARLYLITEIVSHLKEVKFEVANLTLNSNFGDPVYVNESVGLILTSAMNNLQRGKQEDMPFRTASDNETVKVIGSFVNTKSHIPKSQYVLSPFSNIVKDIIPIEKKPTVFDMDLIPQEEKDMMVKDTDGNPSQLATQSMGWAHKIYGNPVLLRRYGKLFKSKILRYYSDMSLLTDEEVLGGYSLKHPLSACLKGMELNSSIGFTMKELFYVSKKSDVISVNDEGKYKWNVNPAAVFLKEMYEENKEIQNQGKKYWSVFNELLKDEKLKLAKIYKARTFTAQDILGVLLERRALGEFCARAMGNDPNCGVGTDPVKDFQKIYVYLNVHPNIWAGDYKKFDRSIPAIIFQILSELLQQCNPKISKQIASTFKVIVERIQVVGKTMCEVYGGMPSGCFSTAPLNSLANEFALFCTFCYLSEENGLTPCFKSYEDNVRRIFYGDDVLVSVSNEYRKIYDRANVARILEQLFGMHMTSSDKGDGIGDYDSYENASWISRFFRQFGGYPMVCGALKKISIGAYFHYVTSNNYEHLGRLMEVALYEAAFWEDEYFNQVQKAVRMCIDKDKRLLKYVNLIDLETLRDQIFHSNIGSALAVCREDPDRYSPTEPMIEIKEIPEAKVGQWGVTTNQLLAEVFKNEELINDWNIRGSEKQSPEINEKSLFFSKFVFKKEYFNLIVQPISKGKMREKQLDMTMCSYAAKLNELFQAGKIQKPDFAFTQLENKTWRCILTIGLESVSGCGQKKQEAKEAASYYYLVKIHQAEVLSVRKISPEVLKKAQKQSRGISMHQFLKIKPQLYSCNHEMMMTPAEKLPQAPMMSPDVSVVTDSGLYTNTDAPSPARVYNNTAIALDNPCGSGAPFNKHQQVYSIYQRWEEKNVIINPSLASGTEIFRVSLDPKTWPDTIKEYVNFHEAIIPAIDIVVAIAGAAGTIGWIVSGWVSDASSGKTYTLNDLQQISAETTNMNGTQIIKIRLEDVRRQGLFRLTENDSEPYPGIVFMIDQAVTNVQRNDSVNYPVRVQMRLAPTCVLMRPFNKPSGSVGIEDFDLGSYFYTNHADMLIGSNSVTSVGSSLQSFPSHGWDNKTWDRTYTPDNFECVVFFDDDFHWVCMGDQTDVSIIDPDLVYTRLWTLRHYGPAAKIVLAYGKVTPFESSIYDLKDFKVPPSSVYQIPQINTHIGGMNYKADKIYVEEGGFHLVLDLDYENHTFVDTEDGKYDAYVCFNTVGNYSDQFEVDASNVNIQQILYVSWDPSVAKYEPLEVKIMDKSSNVHQLSIHNCDFKFQGSSVDTYIFTGNSMPTTALPIGLKTLQFVRKGTTTTVTSETPFVPLSIPLIEGAMTALDRKMEKYGFECIKGDLVSAEVVIGQIGYSNRCFVVRTDVAMKFRSTTNDLIIRNIVGIANKDLTKIQALNAIGFVAWGKSISRYRPKFVPNLFNCRQESGVLLSMLPYLGGGLLQGIGQGLNGWADRNAQREMLNAKLRNQTDIASMNNEALMRRQQQMFQNNMMLTGYSSNSAQQGLSRSGYMMSGPRFGLGYHENEHVQSQNGSEDVNREEEESSKSDLSGIDDSLTTVTQSTEWPSDYDTVASTGGSKMSMKTDVANSLDAAMSRRRVQDRQNNEFGQHHVDPDIPWDVNNKYKNMLYNQSNKIGNGIFKKSSGVGEFDNFVIKPMVQPEVKSTELIKQ